MTHNCTLHHIFLVIVFVMTKTQRLASGMMLLSSSSTQSNRMAADKLARKMDDHILPQQTAHSSPVLPQTQQDQDLTKWFEDQGILLGPKGGRRVEISTTEKSAGGRGLFWAPSPSFQNNGIAHQGDILAHIPGRLVLLPSNMQASYPCMFHDNKTPRGRQAAKDDSSFSWQSVLTTYVWKALHDSPIQNSDNDATPNWREWIARWGADSSAKGKGASLCGPAVPKSSEECSDEMIQDMACLTQSSVALVKELIDEKHATFHRDWDAVKSVLAQDCDQDIDEMKRNFAELYTFVLSRTANLGPEWGNQMGIIPLHDMINHPPFGQEANVELFCLGDIRSMIGNDGLKMLLRPLLTEDQLRGKTEPPIFMDRDFVIAARERIEPHQELFLSYKSSEVEVSKKEQIWLLLQYGFPFRPTSKENKNTS
jgi:hypothetical protein